MRNQSEFRSQPVLRSCSELHIMKQQTDRVSLQSPFRPISVWVFHLLLTHSCRGDSHVIGPRQSIVAGVGYDVILPCYLKPAMDVTEETIEWRRSDLESGLVNVWRDGQDLENERNPSYRGRTSLLTDELKRGNFSLKLSNVQLTDQATYECDIPLQSKNSSVQLVVVSGVVSSPIISLAGIDKKTGGVVLQCESAGWYPEPEVLWLDGEGNLLSAGPTETVRGPDDLYTVSSRVTVEKRHSNSFTCRVQQKKKNHFVETHLYITDDFFNVQSSSAPISTGFIVGLAVCILLILSLILFVLKQKQKMNKIEKSSADETDNREKKNRTNSSENQSVTEERETEQLMMEPTVKMMVLNNEEKQKTKHSEDEQQRMEERIKELETKITQLEEREEAAIMKWTMRDEELKETQSRLESKEEENNMLKRKVDQLSAENKKLQQEKRSREEELKKLKEELEIKKKELAQKQQSWFSWGSG